MLTWNLSVKDQQCHLHSKLYQINNMKQNVQCRRWGGALLASIYLHVLGEAEANLIKWNLNKVFLCFAGFDCCTCVSLCGCCTVNQANCLNNSCNRSYCAIHQETPHTTSALSSVSVCFGDCVRSPAGLIHSTWPCTLSMFGAVTWVKVNVLMLLYYPRWTPPPETFVQFSVLALILADSVLLSLSVYVCSEFLGKTPGQSVQRWVPSRSTRRDVNSSNEKERHDAIFRKVRG